jgi:hypothetical protein
MFAPFIWGYANSATGSAGGGDADADAYIAAINTAGGSLSGAEETAIQTFFTDLKSDGIYSKISVMYPFLGGVANSNKINAINPGTNDLTFNGTWAHSATGSYVDKSGDYADTNFNASASLDLTSDYSFSTMVVDRITSPTYGYSGVGIGAGNYNMVGYDGDNFDSWSGNVLQFSLGGSTQPGVMGMISRTGATAWYGAGLISGSAASSGFVKSSTQTNTVTAFDGNVWINKINSAGFQDGGRYMFSHSGNGLSTTEADNLLTRVNDLQIAFNRNIFS